MANIDSEIIRALIQPDQYHQIGKDAPVKKLVHLKILDYDTEVDIGKKRTADILLTIRRKSKQHKVVIEAENDRKFDVGEILRKSKRQRRYPTMVIIPKKEERHAFRFKKSGILVCYWEATCKWICRKCNKITTSASSLIPIKCANCGKGGNFFLRWLEADVKFEEDKNNPPMNYEKYEMQVSTAKVW